MGISFAPLRDFLEKKGLPRGHLRDACGLSGATVAKIFKDEPTSFEVLDTLCRTLGLPVHGVIRFEDAAFKRAKPRKGSSP